MSAEKNKSSAINLFFVAFVLCAILFAAFSGRMQEITDASFESAKSAVTLAISLIGIMALWLGLVRVLEAGGLMYRLAQSVKPLMTRLFPDVPSEHPAMSAMLLNISANMLGLGNAATPLGIKAMVELNKLNPIPGTATNAMCLFLAINTSSVTLLPLGVIGVRAAAGSQEPAAIFLPTLIATLASTLVGVSVALLLASRDKNYRVEAAESSQSESEQKNEESADILESAEQEDFGHLLVEPNLWWKGAALAAIVALAAALITRGAMAENIWEFFHKELLTYWLMPILMFLIVVFGMCRGVKVYEAVTEGAKQGFDIAVRIIPFLVAILVAIGMFRASGAMELLERVLRPLTSLLYMPPEALPMALVRPLSGSGAFGVMSALVEASPDSYEAYVVSTMQGSTETTFYVMAVYFGSVGIVRLRHALVAALLADLCGIIVSCLICAALWSGPLV